MTENSSDIPSGDGGDQIESEDATFEDYISTVHVVTTAFVSGIGKTKDGDKTIIPYLHTSFEGKTSGVTTFNGLVPLDNAIFVAYSLVTGIEEAMDDWSDLTLKMAPHPRRMSRMASWLEQTRESLERAEKSLQLLADRTGISKESD